MRRAIRNPVLQHGLAIVLAAWAMSMLVRYRLLGSSVLAYLPWIGSILVVLNVLFVVNAFLRPPAGGILHDVVTRVDRIGRLAIVAFVWWAVVVVLNCALDPGPPRGIAAEVVRVGGRTVSAGVPLTYSWADLREAGGTDVVRVVLGPEEQRHFWSGEAIVLVDARGRFGLRWLVRMERDPEPYVRDVLRLTPGAAQPWKELVHYMMEHAREREAAEEGRRYLEAHPDDVEFAYWAGENLNIRGFEAEGLPFLAHAVARHPTRYHSYRLAWVLTRRGDLADAVETLTAASGQYPEAWEFPFLLAYVRGKSGDDAAAIAALERVERLKRDAPEVAPVLARLRARAGGTARVADPRSVR